MYFRIISYILFSFFLAIAGWCVKTTQTVKLKDGSHAIIRPITGSPQDKESMYIILKDSDTCRTMRDGTLWPDQSINNTYSYHVANWQTFKDLESLGIKDHKLTFGFLIFSTDNKIMGMGGIQRSSRDEPYHELYFAFLPPYRNKGLGKQFGRFLMDFYQEVFGDRILEAIILPDNHPSKILMKKLGFLPRLNEKGQPISKRFPRWNNRLYEIYRYTPTSNKE